MSWACQGSSGIRYLRSKAELLQLQVGVKKAHQLAHQHGLPLVPVHHMEAHALVGRLGANVHFPFLCMLVSGGHNMLLVAHAVGDYTLMGSTLDDSVGTLRVSTADTEITWQPEL